MEGIVTKGTTLRGRTLNAGDHVDISPEDFFMLKLTEDIKPVPEEPKEPEESEPETKSLKSKKKN